MYKYPIRDIQFHEEGVRESANAHMDHEETKAVAYHTTALAYLHCGAFHNLPGPAAERIVNGVRRPEVIEDFLTEATDNAGLPYFKHTYKIGEHEKEN